MRTTTRCLAALLATLATTAAVTANAQSAANATLTDLRWQLIDLRPNDGIAPAITFTADEAPFAQIMTFDLDGNLVDSAFSEQFGTFSFSDNFGSGTVTLQSGFVTASVTGFSGDTTVLGTDTFSFKLSPYTRVIFTAEASVNALPDAPNFGFAQASAELFGRLFETPSSPTFLTFQSELTSQGGFNSSLLLAAAETRDLALYGTVSLQADLIGFTEAPPIPEPGSAAMLLAGLGALAFRWRRRDTAPWQAQ